MSKLKPCPHCAKLDAIELDFDLGYHCNNRRGGCGSTGPFIDSDAFTIDEEEEFQAAALEAWNRRAGEAELETALRKLSEKLYGYYDPAFVPRLRESQGALLVAWGDARTLLNKRGGQ